MQYPIDEGRCTAIYEAVHGTASKDAKETLLALVRIANKAYEAGYAEGRKEVAK